MTITSLAVRPPATTTFPIDIVDALGLPVSFAVVHVAYVGVDGSVAWARHTTDIDGRAVASADPGFEVESFDLFCGAERSGPHTDMAGPFVIEM